MEHIKKLSNKNFFLNELDDKNAHFRYVDECRICERYDLYDEHNMFYEKYINFQNFDNFLGI